MSFAPYLIHWFDLATWHEPDSARAANRLEQLRRAAAPDARHVRSKELVFDLMFGDSTTRAGRLAELDTIARAVRVSAISEGFYHARFAWLREAVLRSVLDDTRGRERLPWMARLYQNVAFGQGRVADGLQLLEDPLARPTPRRFCELWEAHVMGLPVSAQVLEEARANAPLVVEMNPCVYLARGAWAAERGDWTEHARARELFGETLDAFFEAQAPDSADVASAHAWRDANVLALDGYAAWLRGEPESAARLLEDAVAHTPAVVRWWLARSHLEQGRPAKAEPWLRTFWWDEHTLAHYHLGKAYEALGDADRAREAYRYFVDGWYEADPELQPLVEEARQKIAILGDAMRPASEEGARP